ncbi:MAG: NAD-dependent epimerase/dehydratase family protein [Elusimicrobia bacterium]|nr:NAD-dependent epimerase/dehydratase family protein [Candidatus Obscuribacterium magneticum]
MKRVLVTGGAGFIGSNIVRMLADRDCQITVLDNFSTGYRENLDGIKNLDVVQGDILDQDLVHKAADGKDTIFHLAASVGNLKSIEDPARDARINVLGTLNILQAARTANVRKVVYSSSSAIFGEVRKLPLDESHPAEPDSPYGVSKLAAEKHCLCFSRLFDRDIVCLRYFNVYGLNQRYDAYGNVIPIWTRRLLNGEILYIYGDGQQTRDFIDVRDVAKANILAAEKTGLRGAFNIGTGRAATINQLADVFRRATSRQLRFEYRLARKGEVKDSQADASLAGRSFGFSATIPLEEGVAEYIRWVTSQPAAVGQR